MYKRYDKPADKSLIARIDNCARAEIDLGLMESKGCFS